MQEILAEYLQQIKDINQGDKEHTYRTFLHTLLIKIQEKAASLFRLLCNLSIGSCPAIWDRFGKAFNADEQEKL